MISTEPVATRSGSPGGSAECPPTLYDRSFLLALGSQTCFVIANTLMAHYARWIEILGGDLRQVGWIMGAGSALGLILRPWMAQWINRIGARTMWGIGYLVFSTSSLANLLLDDLDVTIYVLRSGLVLGSAIVFASGLTYISQIAPEGRRTEAIGMVGVGGFLGMLVGPFLGDVFLGSEAREQASFVNLFVVAALANLLPAFFLVFMRSPGHDHRETSLGLAQFVATTRRFWPGMILLVDLVFGVCITVPFVFMASFIDQTPVRMEHVSVIGLFFWCYAGIAICVRLILRQLPDKIGAHRVLIAGLVLMSLGMFAFALVTYGGAGWIVVPALLTGLGHGLVFHTMTSLTLAPFPTALRGTGSALALMMLDLGTFAGAPVLGQIGARFGFTALFSSVGAVCLLAAVAYNVSLRYEPMRRK